MMKGKVAIITASSTGIGKAIANTLAAEGCKVVISSRNQEHVDKAVNQLKQKGYDALGVVCHVGKQTDLQNLVNKTIQHYGRLDYLVPNCAVSTQFGNFFQAKDQTIKKMWDINYHSVFKLIVLALPHLTQQKNSSIVIISSYGAYELPAIIGHYSITKTALLALAKLCAKQLKDEGVRVNTVAPGLIKTDFSGVLWKENEQKAAENIGVNRLGVPEDVSKAVKFLLSDDANYITGECLPVVGRPLARL